MGLVELRQDVGERCHLDDVGRVPAAGAFGVERVDGASLERGDGVLDETELVQRVGVDHHLHIEAVGNAECAVNCGGRGAPVLVQLQARGAGTDHLLQRGRTRCIALAGECEIDRQTFGRLQHAREMPRSGRASGGGGASGGPGAAADQRGDAGGDRILNLLRADEVDMRIDAASGEDLALAGDDLRAWADDDVDAGLNVGIAGLADLRDAAVGYGRCRPSRFPSDR